MKRRVYYIHGFDHRGVPWYYKFFKNSAPSNFKIGELENDCFKINDDIEFVILSWQEIVKKNWFKTFKVLLIFLLHYIQFFFTSKYRSIQKMDTKLAAIIKYTIFLSFFSLLICSIVFFLFGFFAFLAVFFVLILSLIYIFKKFNLFWLFLTNYFVYKKISIDLLNSTTEIFLNRFNEIEKNNPAEEVVFLAHSVGTVYLQKLINMISNRKDCSKKIAVAISFGSILPFFYLNKKEWLCNQLRIFSNHGIPWHDFSAKSDALCFFRTDLYKLCGISDVSVYLHNLRFATYFKPARWKKIRSNKLLVHFLYFKRFQCNAQYNFFEMLDAENIHDYLERLPRD